MTASGNDGRKTIFIGWVTAGLFTAILVLMHGC